jgi:Fe-S cluster assembly iron-binding protein IscA
LLSFTDRAGGALRLVLDLAPRPDASLRITTRQGRGGVELQLWSASRLNSDDELVLAPDGIPIFVDTSVVPMLHGALLDGWLTEDGRPRFVLHRSTSSNGANGSNGHASEPS